MAECIHSSQLFETELRTAISMLNHINIPANAKDVPETLIKIYQAKIEKYQQMSDICSAMIAGPKPGIDYGDLAAAMPKIRANIETLDHVLFQTSPLVFSALIDQHPDKENHLSHLVITKLERDELIKGIDLAFGKKMEQDKQNWYVSAASVLKYYLTEKGYKLADEPW